MTTRGRSKDGRGGRRSVAVPASGRYVRRAAGGHCRETDEAAGTFLSSVRKANTLDSDYLALVRRFPLRPIRDAREYDAAAEVLDRLVTKDEHDLTAGERDYLDTLTLLVERYDDEHYGTDAGPRRPAETLKYLMEQCGMGVSDLGRVLGSQPAASMVLHGRRELSKSQIRKLAEHFKVEPGLFL